MSTETVTPEAPAAVHLTKRDLEVMNLASEGLSAHAMGKALYVSKRTIDFHLSNIYEKLGVNNRMKAVQELRRQGILL